MVEHSKSSDVWRMFAFVSIIDINIVQFVICSMFTVALLLFNKCLKFAYLCDLCSHSGSENTKRYSLREQYKI